MADITQQSVTDLLRNLPERIGDVIKPWAERLPDQPALVEASGTWTYRQLALVVAETQAWLIDSGVRPGDRVMVVCENCRAFVATSVSDCRYRRVAGAGQCAPLRKRSRCDSRPLRCPAVIYTTGVSPQAREHAKRHGAVISSVAEFRFHRHWSSERASRTGTNRRRDCSNALPR